MKILFFLLIVISGALSWGATSGKAAVTGGSDLQKQLNAEKDPEKKFAMLAQAAQKFASDPIPAEKVREAQFCADSILQTADHFKNDPQYGLALHHANLILGRVMLLQNRPQKAEDFLTRAGNVPASKEMQTKGPNMTLAKELLQIGLKDAVLKYMDECAHFWSSIDAQASLDSWRQIIQDNRVPSFRDNLQN